MSAAIRIGGVAVAAVIGMLASGCREPAPCASPPGPHLSSCSDACCGDGNNPPTSGGHCPTPLPCRVYTTEQLRCQWVHNLEHGHLVLLYNCPDGCDDLLPGLQSVWESRPVASGARRALLAPDSRIPARFAAVVWGRSLVADSVDLAALNELISHQDEFAPEAGLLCAP
jgi:hypothetical protein